MAKFNFSFHFTFTPRDDSCLMEACVSRLLYCSGPSWDRGLYSTVFFLLYRNFFLSGAKNEVLIGMCLLELRLEILGFGHRVLDVKLLFLVTYTAN